MNILECYMPIFKLISSIKVTPEKYTSYADTRNYIIEKIDTSVRHSEKIELSNDEIDAAFYAIVVMLDETILCSDVNFKKEWRDNLLQSKFFNHSIGGVEFFRILDNVIEMQSKVRWVFLLCLLLGFRGKYSVNGNNEIRDYIARLKIECCLELEDKYSSEDKYHKNWNGKFSFLMAILCVISIYTIMLMLLYIK